MSAPVKCPHCGGDVDFHVVAVAKAKSRVTMTIAPHEGELLGAAVLGEKIEAFANLMKKAAEAEGSSAKIAVLVEKAETAADGSVSVTLLVLPQVSA
jgi:hypothetical protein